MKPPAHLIEIFLHPGELYFGDESTRIRTLLGSCVSITMWHPRNRIGGMCHYMLPARPGGRADTAPDGRYADEAMQLLFDEARRCGTDPGEYEVKMFGGGDMFPAAKRQRTGHPGAERQDVPRRNVLAARAMARDLGVRIVAEHLGGSGHRQVLFDVWSGNVWLRSHAQAAVVELETVACAVT